MTPLLAPLLAAGLLAADPSRWLDFDVSRPRDSLVLLQGKVAAVQPVSTVYDSLSHLGFGQGSLKIKGFVPPTGSWHVVSVFRLRAYGDTNSWFHSSLINTSTWPIRVLETNDPIQGFQFRTGGGPVYSPYRLGSSQSDSDFTKSLTPDDHLSNSSLSRCLLSWAMATTDPSIYWTQISSDRCVEIGRWHVAVTSWDGSLFSLFLDGKSVLDTLRVIGKGLPIRMDRGFDVYIGSRGDNPYDPQLLFGSMSSLSIRPGALDEAGAVRLYRELLPASEAPCEVLPVIQTPLAMQIVEPGDSVRVRLEPSAGCAAGAGQVLALGPGDSVEVLALTPDDRGRVLGGHRSAQLSFPIENLRLSPLADNGMRLKARLLKAPSPVAARALSSESWGPERPMRPQLADRNGVAHRARPSGFLWTGRDRLLVPGATSLKALRPDGSSRRVQALPGGRGEFDLASLPKGAWILSAPGATIPFAKF